MIRLPRANKQSFYYANWKEKTTEYKTDDDGNVLYVEVRGKQVPIEKEIPAHYTEPKAFKASMNMGGGRAEAVEFGVDMSDYSAVLTTPKGIFNITETSLIWFETKPKHKADGTVDENSADYTVAKVRSSLYYDRFLLAKRAKRNG